MTESKIILITGANRGIGKETARQLTSLGHHVLIGSRNHADGQAVAEELGGASSAIQLDVTDAGSIDAATARIASEHGRLDVLINNAGVLSSSEGVSDSSTEEIKRVTAVNFHGPWMVSKSMLPLLRKSPEARIINLSSGMGALDSLTGGHAPYRLSKVALNGLTILLSNELSEEGISVNSVCPGWVRTDMGGADASRPVEKGAETPVWLATHEPIPNGRFLRDKKIIPW